jgi:hypothetical protein
METQLPPPFVPFYKLAQSNMALLTEFWLSPEVMWQPFLGTPRPFGAMAGTVAGTAAGNTAATSGVADAWSRLTKGVMENYSRFFVEVAQAGFAPWGRKAGEASAVTA